MGDGALSPYRVLDLSEGGCNFTGKILADLGADVIRVEPPGGSPTRSTPPFYQDQADPEKSLFWFAFNINKRGVTLDITREDGKELLRRLVKGADILIESYKPGYLKGLGLDYDALSQIKPGLVVTSITPFGQEGPYAPFRGSDLVVTAMGGMLYMNGDPDRPPVRISFPVMEAVAGGQAVAGTMHALWHKINTGEGQQVDVSMQWAVTWLITLAVFYPQFEGYSLRREGTYRGFSFVRWRQIYPCRDGYISLYVMGGGAGARSMRALEKWMDEEGMAPEWMRGKKWEEWSPGDLYRRGQTEALAELRAVEGAVERFFLTKSWKELFDRAAREHILLAPCYDAKDIVKDEHFGVRGFWVDVDHPELGRSITYPGPYLKMSQTPITYRMRAPLVGEHNQEIYCGELGLSRSQLQFYQSVGVV